MVAGGALCVFASAALDLLEGIRDRLAASAANTPTPAPPELQKLLTAFNGQTEQVKAMARAMQALVEKVDVVAAPPAPPVPISDRNPRHVVRHAPPYPPNLLLHYLDSHGHNTERQVTVLKVEPHTTWLDGKPHEDGCFYAYCHMRHGFRQFRLDRVMSAADAATGEVVTSIAAFASSHGRAVPA